MKISLGDPQFSCLTERHDVGFFCSGTARASCALPTGIVTRVILSMIVDMVGVFTNMKTATCMKGTSAPTSGMVRVPFCSRMEVCTAAISPTETSMATAGMNSTKGTMKGFGSTETTRESERSPTKTEVTTPVVSKVEWRMGWARNGERTEQEEGVCGRTTNLMAKRVTRALRCCLYKTCLTNGEH